MNFLMNLFKRISAFDPKKVTPIQIVIGVVVVVVALSVISFVLSLAQTLLPLALLALAGYVGYQWLSSREPQETIIKAKSVKSAQKSESVADDSKAQTTIGELANNQKSEADEAARRLRVEPLTNPETGILEADLSRLEAEEQARLSQKDADAKAVQEQIEARRRRLLGNDDQ